MNTIGVCEDDDELRAVIKRALETEGATVIATASGTEAVRVFSEGPVDVLILDVGLPDADGRDVCAALRARGIDTPVVFLTARDALVDRLSGFRAGGDDYLTKPFALSELVVRVQALQRRATTTVNHDGSGLILDPGAHALMHDGHRVPLTPTEFRLLSALAASPGTVLRRASLVAAGWTDGAVVHDNTLDAYIARIRRKLRAADASVSIDTARGVGYVLQ